MSHGLLRVLTSLLAIGWLSGLEYQAKAGEAVVGNVVVVWHVDAREHWIGYGPNVAKMETSLLKHCNKAMQSGCKVAMSFSTGAAVLGRMANGKHILMYSKISKEDAQRSMVDECRRQETHCELLRIFETATKGGKPRYELPKKSPELYRRYGAVVWQSRVTAPVRIWVAAGRRTSALAEGDALANCRADTGGECVVAQYGSDTVMIVFTEDGKRLAMAQDQSLEKAQNVIKDLCLAKKQTCKLQVAVDAKVEETSVHQLQL